MGGYLPTHEIASVTRIRRYGSALAWFPVVAWVSLLFFFSSLPSTPSPLAFAHADKFTHAVAFGVLGGLLAFSRLPFRLGSIKRIALVTILVAAYGVSDEFHQSFVAGRDASIWDALADSIGGFAAAVGVAWWQRRG
jgi:VanZ family protein